MGWWGSWGQYNSGLAPPLTVINDGGGTTMRVSCTPLRGQHAPTHFRRSRGRKEIYFQNKKAGGLRAGPSHSKEECTEAL